MSLQDELRKLLDQNSQALNEARSYEQSLREYAESILKREISFDRAAYMLERDYPNVSCDKWFTHNDLRTIINQLVPIRKGQ